MMVLLCFAFCLCCCWWLLMGFIIFLWGGMNRRVFRTWLNACATAPTHQDYRKNAFFNRNITFLHRRILFNNRSRLLSKTSHSKRQFWTNNWRSMEYPLSFLKFQRKCLVSSSLQKIKMTVLINAIVIEVIFGSLSFFILFFDAISVRKKSAWNSSASSI